MPEEHNRRLTDHLLDAAADALARTRTRTSRRGHRRRRDRVRRQHDDRHAARATSRPPVELAAWREYGLEQRELRARDAPPTARSWTTRVLSAQTIAALEQRRARPAGALPGAPADARAPRRRSASAPSACSSSPPLPYVGFLSLQAGAAAVVTDSGGIQEETTALGVRCFTLRDNTERPVTVDARHERDPRAGPVCARCHPGAPQRQRK